MGWAVTRLLVTGRETAGGSRTSVHGKGEQARWPPLIEVIRLRNK